MFTTNIEVEIGYNSKAPAGFDYESRKAKGIIKYGVRLELREWGMKGLLFFVPEQEIILSLELLEKGEEQPEEILCKVLLKACTITSEDIPLNHDICPSELVLELKRLSMIPDNQHTFSLEAEAEGELVFNSRAS